MDQSLRHEGEAVQQEIAESCVQHAFGGKDD
jgi:hypothetical protein